MNDNTVIYEQPLNEVIRVCLRLEQVFFQIDHQLKDASTSGTRNILSSIINVLQLLDRPDLKAKLAKELSLHMTLLLRLEQSQAPEIDHLKLKELLRQLEELSRILIDSSGKIAQSLREVELLNNLRLHLASPGGGCSFDLPLYHYWLQQPSEQRFSTIRLWLNEFDNIRLTVHLVLRLIREGSKIQTKNADNGFYQELLDPQLNLKLIRVAVPNDIQTYPEISIGRHFLSIRFFEPTIKDRPTQYASNLQFWLSYCSS
jgi:cell division protein ZapD